MFELRAYQLHGHTAKTVGELEASVEGRRLFVPRLRRGAEIIKADPTTTLMAGDICAVAGLREVLVETIAKIGTEVEDRELLDTLRKGRQPQQPPADAAAQ